MEPRLCHGQLVVVRRKYGGSVAGKAVMFRHAGMDKVKRIADVSADQVFVLGDNLEESTDSRHFGWIGKESVIGSVIWPRI